MEVDCLHLILFFPAVSAKAAGFISLDSMMSVAVLMFLVELPIGIYLVYFLRRGG